MNTLFKKISKLPIDFGQENLKYTTKGKLIALDLIKNGGEGKIALDVGCRNGYFSKMLEKMGYRVVSIDIEPNYEKSETVDANKPLPYEDNFFDIIWCSEVIEHLENPHKTLSEFKRILKPDGQAVITTPNSQFLPFRILKIFGFAPQKIQNRGHLHFFGIEDIKKFSPEIIYGFFPHIFLKCRIKKMINLLSPTFVFTIKK